ncbi:hypothetical protein FIBSPDRAFT_947095 [Athelia psychrophila]|uniref:Nudix hydrolase domain-containing protein n=1 Tax=Athelia psychrophila TaxID=1759441 RepID=A0A166S719_9AGAM|nr:hypothetical protein FIBSPDRAFT_947095 [Fibularhizoctonia sp. CBS 109695]
MAPAPSLEKQYMSSASAPKKMPMAPRPSASILLISPTNEILLLHRVRTSSAFPSAHVFPGGNLSASQDGAIPAPDAPDCHVDGPAYRIGAIRECFEESGILLARTKEGRFLDVPEAERERARKEIHAERLRFVDWVEGLGGVVDSNSLVPFTRWITPTNVPKRFSTQMYIYWLDLPSSASSSTPSPALDLPTTSEAIIPIPTSDGGLEHTAALFAPLETWLRQASANEIILFPPQFYLMHLLAPFLAPSPSSSRKLSTNELQAQRTAAMAFVVGDGDGRGVTWADKVMSPVGLFMRKGDGRSVLALDKPGPELADSGRTGDWDRVVLAKFGKGGPTDVEVRTRKDVLEEERAAGREKGKL